MRVPAAGGWHAWEGKIPVGSRYTFGIAGQRFLEALVDDGEILASLCSRCDLAYVPMALFCERCFAELTETRAVGPVGEVVALTVAHQDLDGEPIEPQVVAAVRLDGATSVLVHKGMGRGWAIGARVRVVLAEDRTGSINDIAGFEVTG
jgi:uncharacterized OB-fold protein